MAEAETLEVKITTDSASKECPKLKQRSIIFTIKSVTLDCFNILKGVRLIGELSYKFRAYLRSHLNSYLVL